MINGFSHSSGKKQKALFLKINRSSPWMIRALLSNFFPKQKNSSAAHRDGMIVCSTYKALTEEIFTVRNNDLMIYIDLNSFVRILESPSAWIFTAISTTNTSYTGL